jgi:hypothetical protein
MGRRHPRAQHRKVRLAGAGGLLLRCAVALIAETGLGAGLCLPAPVRGQRPAFGVHLLETAFRHALGVEGVASPLHGVALL